MAVLTEEQTLLKDAATAWVQERAPVSAFRKMRGSALGYDPKVYAEMAEMGWTGVLAPEDFGGTDFGHLGLGLVLEQLGRNLTASPLASTSVVIAALTLCGSPDQKARWIPALVAGDAVGTLAVDEGSHHAPERVALQATPAGNGWRLSGTKRPVLEGMAASLAIVAARTPGGVTLFIVDMSAKGLTRTSLEQIDSRGAAMLTFDQVEVDGENVLGPVDGGAALLDRILDAARAGLAAEMLGSAQQAFDTTVDYLKTRVQFGRLIGSFQALQHRAAQMLGEIELTRSAVEAALVALDEQSPEAPQLVSLAKALASETFNRVSSEMVQMHGGIGMTDEHDAGLYLKRARTTAACYGNAAFHRDRYGRLVGF